MKNDFFEAKKKISTIWFIGGGFLITLVFVQTLTGRYDNIIPSAWQWFLPTVLPNLSLIVTSSFFGKTDESMYFVESIFFQITKWCSIAYLVFILFIILSYTYDKGNIIDYYKKYNFFITGVQTLVFAALASFFSNKNSK
jgi:hypothetical protein